MAKSTNFDIFLGDAIKTFFLFAPLPESCASSEFCNILQLDKAPLVFCDSFNLVVSFFSFAKAFERVKIMFPAKKKNPHHVFDEEEPDGDVVDHVHDLRQEKRKMMLYVV